MDMRKRIDLELRGQDPETIKELNLDSCRGQQLDGLTDDFKNLEILSMINVGLTTLKGWPKLTNLRKLELSDNRIFGGLENLLTCPNLTHLNLSGNKIKDLADLAPLAKLSNLRNIDLFNCEVTKIETYRDMVFKLLPSLKFLDGFDINEQEDEEEEYGCDDSEDDVEGEDGDSDEEVESEDEDDVEESDEEVEGQNGVKGQNGVEGQNGVATKAKNGVVAVAAEDSDEDDSDEVVESEDGSLEEDCDDENEVGLSYLQKENLDDEEESDDEDFDAEKAALACNQTGNTTQGTVDGSEDECDEEEVDDLYEGDEQAKLAALNDDSNSRTTRKRKFEEENLKTGDDSNSVAQ